jgi:hypothetical protein
VVGRKVPLLMPFTRQTPLITDFTAGELSPDLYGRTDQPLYYRGASVMKNFKPKLVGGFRKRVGSLTIGHTEGDASALLVIVTLSTETSYLFEFTENNINIWHDDVLIDNVITTYAVDELDELQFAWDFPDLTITHQEHAPSHMHWTTPDTWAFEVWPITGVTGEIPFQGAGDYPRCCAAAFQRLAFANTKNEPQTVWETKVGVLDSVGTSLDFTYYDTVTYTVKQMDVDVVTGLPTADPPTYTDVTLTKDVVSEDSAFTFKIASDTTDEIQWLAANIDFFMGTASGEWVLPGTATADDYQAVPINTRVGSAPIQGSLLSGGLVFIQAGGRRVFQLGWEGMSNPNSEPNDLAVFSDHLFKANPIIAWDWMQAPEPTAIFLREDGTLVAVLMNISMQVRGWWNIETDGVVTSIAVMPTTSGDVLYMAVLRNTDQMMIEKMADQEWTDIIDAHYVDSGLWKTSVIAFTVIQGLDYLEGETVSMIGDGAYLGTAVVAGGEVTLPVACTSAHVGLPFKARVQTMPIEAAANYGSAQMKKKNITHVDVRYVNTLDLNVGPNETDLESAVLEDSDGTRVDVTAPNPVPQSGDERVKIQGMNQKRGYVNIVSDLPLPCEVTAIVPDIGAAE